MDKFHVLIFLPGYKNITEVSDSVLGLHAVDEAMKKTENVNTGA